jgi:predicted N-acetyltransferase YhbS
VRGTEKIIERQMAREFNPPVSDSVAREEGKLIGAVNMWSTSAEGGEEEKALLLASLLTVSTTLRRHPSRGQQTPPHGALV